MRSIGKIRIKQLNKIIKQECQIGGDVKGRVIERLPLDWWDTWEGAHQEIHRLIMEVACG